METLTGQEREEQMKRLVQHDAVNLEVTLTDWADPLAAVLASIREDDIRHSESLADLECVDGDGVRKSEESVSGYCRQPPRRNILVKESDMIRNILTIVRHVRVNERLKTEISRVREMLMSSLGGSGLDEDDQTVFQDLLSLW